MQKPQCLITWVPKIAGLAATASDCWGPEIKGLAAATSYPWLQKTAGSLGA